MTRWQRCYRADKCVSSFQSSQKEQVYTCLSNEVKWTKSWCICVDLWLGFFGVGYWLEQLFKLWYHSLKVIFEVYSFCLMRQILLSRMYHYFIIPTLDFWNQSFLTLVQTGHRPCIMPVLVLFPHRSGHEHKQLLGQRNPSWGGSTCHHFSYCCCR